MGGMSSGLHVAIRARQDQLAWMLILLASNLALDQFPPEVHEGGKVDIRTLRDAEGEDARAAGS